MFGVDLPKERFAPRQSAQREFDLGLRVIRMAHPNPGSAELPNLLAHAHDDRVAPTTAEATPDCCLDLMCFSAGILGPHGHDDDDVTAFGQSLCAA